MAFHGGGHSPAARHTVLRVLTVVPVSMQMQPGLIAGGVTTTGPDARPPIVVTLTVHEGGGGAQLTTKTPEQDCSPAT